MNDPEVIGHRAEQSTWLDRAARVGLIAYGVVYLLLAWLAIQLALGDQSEDASPKGALHELAKQPFGKILVWGIALGMLLLVVWRLTEAAFGQRRKMLRQSLKGMTGALEALATLGIDPQRRAETLSVEEFVALARALA